MKTLVIFTFLLVKFFKEYGNVHNEIRQLKDIKNLLSENTVPKSIKILRNTIKYLFLILITLLSKIYDIINNFQCSARVLL